LPDPNTDELLDQEETDEEQPEESSEDELSEDLQKTLLRLYQKCSAEDRYPRLIEVKDVKQAENYWAGRQYDWWSRSEQTWKPITTATGGAGQTDSEPDDMPRFQFVTNIYQARGLMMIGAVAGAPPRLRFFPDDADDSKDLETAAGRTKLTKLIERWNPPQLLLQEETYHAWTGGFIAWWTRYVPNGEKYGIDSVELLSQGAVDVESSIACPECGWSAPAEQAVPPVPCPNCGHQLTEENVSDEGPIPVPEDGGEQQIPKGRQVISAFGALNSKRPQHTKDQSQWHYFAIEEEIHYSTLRGAFQDKAKEIKPGMNFGPDDVFERNARLSIAENSKTPTQSAQAMANLVTFARVWFRPTAFWMLDEEDQRDELLEKFPRGCRVEFAGLTYCTSEAESMDDAIVSCHAMPGRGQHRPAVGSSTMSVQDRINTFSNIEAETYEYGIPITYRASDTFASEADDDQRAAPGLEVEVALLPGADMRQRIMQVRADSVSPDMAKHTMDLMGPVADQMSGTYPALSGAGSQQGAPDTLGQQAMQRDQAMGRMGIFYVPLKQAHADVMTLSCRCFEAHSEGEVKIPVFGASGDFESESVDVTALEGEAEAYPEGDENFPELWNQQRATMMQIMDTPYGQALSKEPGNAELFGKMTGIPDLKIPGLDSWRKQLKEISELTKIPQGDDLLAGIAPSVEVDSDDFHDLESACCKWWMNDEKGQKIKRENPMGWMAVKQHKAQHDAQIPPPNPPVKPLSETLNSAFKDLPPEAQAQVLAQWGIHVTPQAFVEQAALEQAKKAPKPMPGQPQPGGPQLPPAAGVQ
jgi:hypothetical protein